MRISWIEDGRLVAGAEFFCDNVDRDLTKCDAYIRLKGNEYQTIGAAIESGWRVSIGDLRCPDHLPSVQKDIRKGK